MSLDWKVRGQEGGGVERALWFKGGSTAGPENTTAGSKFHHGIWGVRWGRCLGLCRPLAGAVVPPCAACEQVASHGPEKLLACCLH